jgi:hypothetical protein
MPVRYGIPLSGLGLAAAIHAFSAPTNFRYRPQTEHPHAHFRSSAPMSREAQRYPGNYHE